MAILRTLVFPTFAKQKVIILSTVARRFISGYQLSVIWLLNGWMLYEWINVSEMHRLSLSVLYYFSLNTGPPPSVIVPYEGELRAIDEKGDQVSKYRVFMPLKRKITTMDIHIVKKYVFVGSRQGKMIGRYHYNGMYVLQALFFV